MMQEISYLLNQTWVYYTLFGIYAATVIAIIMVVISENRNPVKSLAWVTVLLMLPVVGIIFYIFFGRSIKNKHLMSRRNRRQLKKQENAQSASLKDVDLAPLSRQAVILSKSVGGLSLFTGNDIKIYNEGASKFTDLTNDLRNARESINIQYYIFADDGIGRIISDILIEKSRQGVDVRVIYDHVGSLKTRNRFFKQMSLNGIKVHPFFKVTFPGLGTRINWRNHRKIVTIDNVIGYIGGMNIADRYADGGKDFRSWRDTHLRVTGPIVKSLNLSFNTDWNLLGYELPPPSRFPFDRKQYKTQSQAPILNPYAPPTVEAKNITAQLVISGPTQQWSNIGLLFMKIISGAQKRIFIQTPYFLPTEGLLRALQTAALSHVDVRIMIPVKSDSMLLTYASSSYVSECLKSGIKIYFYTPGMLHSKTMIVDDEISTVGSANFDFRSFEHNFEGNLVMYSKEMNEKLAEVFIADMTQCTRIKYDEWHKRPRGRRAVESVVRLLSPIL